MVSLKWKIVLNVRARDGCRNFSNRPNWSSTTVKPPARKRVMEFSMHEAYQRKLNRNVIRCRKIFAVIRLTHKYLSDFYCRKRTFSRGTKAFMLRKKRYQNIDWIDADAGDFLPSGTLFLGSSEQGKWEIWHTVLVVIWLVEVVFYYHSLLLSIRHLSQDKRRKGPQRNRSNKCWDKARHHARTPRNFIGGNPTGSAVKTNGRAGTRTSGSSKGSPELGLANDSRELLTNKKTANAVLLWSKFWAYQLKTAWSRWDTIQRWCAIRGTTRSTNGQSSDIQPEGASNNITVVGREILPRKASNLSMNSRTACSRISPYWVEWHDVSKIQRIGRSPWSNKWQIKIKPININYITRKFYVHSLLWRSRQ